jgi:hypothetical protein
MRVDAHFIDARIILSNAVAKLVMARRSEALRLLADLIPLLNH